MQPIGVYDRQTRELIAVYVGEFYDIDAVERLFDTDDYEIVPVEVKRL